MFGKCVEAAARAHAIAQYPKESCGFVVVNGYVPLHNIASDPEATFEVAKEEWIAHGRVQAVIHSHGPQFALEPSAADMRQQIATDVPWAITQTDGVHASPLLWWGDFRLDEPLLGRKFIHGVTDCYGAIRAWYWQNKQVRLPDFPRDNNWWRGAGDLYNAGFGQAGFRQIPEDQARPGDVVLMAVRSKVPNHGGVLIEGGLVFHHLQNRQSCREPAGRWHSLASKWLRYEG